MSQSFLSPELVVNVAGSLEHLHDGLAAEAMIALLKLPNSTANPKN